MLETQNPEKSAAYSWGGFALFVAAGVIVAALGFQYIGGYAPCPLCLMQRYAYYASIPLLFVAMAFAQERPGLATALFIVVALAFLGNAGLGGYHAGVEWKFWPGPDTCGTVQAIPTSAADLLNEATSQKIIRCDEAAWRFAGLSFAGWNVLVSLLLFVSALKAAVVTAESRG